MLRSGITVVLVAALGNPVSAQVPFRITEILANPSAGDQIVEITNTSGTAADLGGVFRLTRGAGGRRRRIENRSPVALRDAFAIDRGGLYPLNDLAPGQAEEIDLLNAIPFTQWRLSALDRASRSWRQLVTAALSGRDLEGSLLLIGRIDSERQVVSGVAEEQAQAALLVITASQETR